MSGRYRIKLLFNANKIYDRQVMAGIGRYIQTSRCDWEIILEEDFRIHGYGGHLLQDCDGVIADCDDPELEKLLCSTSLPVVGVGSSYQDPALYPDCPYVATDNLKLVELAYRHLQSKGLEHFAFYGGIDLPQMRWARQRLDAYKFLLERDGYPLYYYQGEYIHSGNWSQAMGRLQQWIASLPLATGVIAVTDARAHHLLQASDYLGRVIPEELAVIGIDNEEVTRSLSRIPLSSVEQGCDEMGFQAAHMLEQRLSSRPLAKKRVIVPPVRVCERQSSEYQALKDPSVIRALHYIRRHACRGIKVQQVLDFVSLSRSNLEGRFQASCGHSIHQEIHQFKLNKAKHLLLESELSMQEIANACGYPSLQYLYAVFRKDMGQTLLEYRQQAEPEVRV
ncbi:XylR family transcriptional regulator [Dongshaea marina]|uniref:XylR family transcriptional regulator n=1 Tax=Dongshaea marina TaxID=2047966 RepID=UPI001F17EEBC|nr:DNA-binding transcriptional regulator [Dongshaea marina]